MGNIKRILLSNQDVCLNYLQLRNKLINKVWFREAQNEVLKHHIALIRLELCIKKPQKKNHTRKRKLMTQIMCNDFSMVKFCNPLGLHFKISFIPQKNTYKPTKSELYLSNRRLLAGLSFSGLFVSLFQASVI